MILLFYFLIFLNILLRRNFKLLFTFINKSFWWLQILFFNCLIILFNFFLRLLYFLLNFLFIYFRWLFLKGFRSQSWKLCRLLNLLWYFWQICLHKFFKFWIFIFLCHIFFELAVFITVQFNPVWISLWESWMSNICWTNLTINSNSSFCGFSRVRSLRFHDYFV